MNFKTFGSHSESTFLNVFSLEEESAFKSLETLAFPQFK